MRLFFAVAQRQQGLLDIALGIGDEVLSPVMFPVLHQLLGQTLITTDGKTLLGADDKAGIAEIMTALAVLKEKNIPHGDIRVAFTPDEEVGKGAKHFDVEAFNAQWAYTIDGGGVGRRQIGVTHTDGQGIHQHRRIILPQAAGHQKHGGTNPADGYPVPAGTAEGHPRNQPRRV